ncbi:MAG: type II secretion system F family protein [Candidatus Aenigmatarchaeota archaeon]
MKKTKRKLIREDFIGSKIFFVILFAAAVLVSIITGMVLGGVVAINMLIILVLAIAVPHFLWKFLEFKKIKSYEDQFPNFLRDLSGSIYAGLSIIQAIQAASESSYGSLTKEIKKINDQLSWNIPLEIVLERFSKHMAKSETISRSMMIIGQSHKSGGNMERILGSLATNIEKIKDVETEKNTLMGQQVNMMYAIFFIFVGISIVLIMFLVPLLQKQEISQIGGLGGVLGGGGANPCEACVNNPNPACVSCALVNHVSTTFSFHCGKDAQGATVCDTSDPNAYYKSLFLLMIVIQGFCSGLVAGQIGSNSVIAGIKHSLIMVVSGFVIFLIANSTILVKVVS